jgi:flavodoxin
MLFERNEHMIYYFTGSGNSLWTARTLGEKLGEDGGKPR